MYDDAKLEDKTKTVGLKGRKGIYILKGMGLYLMEL